MKKTGLCLCFFCLTFILPLAASADAEKTEAYYCELLATSPELQAYDAELGRMREDFFALFSQQGAPSARAMVSDWYQYQRCASLAELANSLDEPETFIRLQLADRALIDFMRMMSMLAEAPDARLQFVVFRMLHPWDDELSVPSSPAGLLVAFDAIMNTSLPTDAGDATYSLSEDGNTLSFDIDLGTSTYIENHSMAQVRGGAFYGWSNVDHWGRFGREQGIKDSLIEVKDGLISFLRPAPAPEEKDFFLTPDEVNVWGYPQDWQHELGLGIQDCWMSIRYHPSPDFIYLRAELYQYNHPDNASPDWLCTPQCELIYQREGNAYYLSGKECKPNSEWGMKRTTESL